MAGGTPVRMRGVELGTRRGGILFGATGGAGAQAWWDDTILRQAGLNAFRSSTVEAGKFAQSGAARSSSRVARSVTWKSFTGGKLTGTNLVSIIRAGHPLAHLFEEGANPHVIAPRNSLGSMIARGRTASTLRAGRAVRRTSRRGGGQGVALRFPDGGFSRAPVDHPGMGASPFMKPAAMRWPALFRAHMGRNL